MQKKLIALAVAGLVSAPAFAQSNVTVYGLVDMGFSHSSKSDSGDYRSRSGIDSGLQSGSRIGFRGVEDLGNGLKAAFVLEYGLTADQNTGIGSSGGATARQQYLALVGGFGTVAAGRQNTPQYNLLTKVDPFETGTVGDVNFGRGVYMNGAYAAPNTLRLNNLLAYVSPDFNGFNVVAGYTANGVDLTALGVTPAGNDEQAILRGNDSTNVKVWAINPNYSNGPLFIGLNYHQVKIDAGSYKDKVWDLGAAYDFGPVRLSAVYGQMKTDNASGNDDAKTKQWLIGASIPVSEAGKVLVSYARNTSDLDNDSKAKARKIAVGYTHELSKRTNLYTAYARISTNDAAENRFNISTALGGHGDYTSGFNVGIRHKF